MRKKIDGLSVSLKGNKKNKAIIFLHGFPYDLSIWKSQVDLFSENYYCVSYDIRGLGKSSIGDGQFTMESFVDDLENIMKNLQLKAPILCGFSMGGYIALRALERMEEKFSAAILCDTVTHADNNEGKLNRSVGIANINKKGLKVFCKTFIEKCYSDFYKKNNIEKVSKRIEKSIKYNPTGVKGSLLAMMTRNDTTDYLNSIKIPTLLLCGEHDTITPPSIMKLMSKKIDGSKLTIIKNSGHMSMMENSIDVNKAISKFLKKL